MTGSLEEPSNLKPSYKKDNEAIWREIRKLWLAARKRNFGERYDVPFSLPGNIYVSESGRYYLPNSGGRLAEILVSLRVAGSTTTTIEVRKNGTLITGGSVNLVAASNQIIKMGFDEQAGGNTDYWTVAVTAAGTGAKFLTTQLRFKLT